MISLNARMALWLSARRATVLPGSESVEPRPLGASKVTNTTAPRRFVAAPISAAMPPIFCVVFIFLLYLAIHFTASPPAPHVRQPTGSDALPRMRGQRRVDPALRPLQRPQPGCTAKVCVEREP